MCQIDNGTLKEMYSINSTQMKYFQKTQFLKHEIAFMQSFHQLQRILTGTVSVISSDPPFKDYNALFKTVPLGPETFDYSSNRKVSLFKHVGTRLNSSKTRPVRCVQSNLNAADLLLTQLKYQLFYY